MSNEIDLTVDTLVDARVASQLLTVSYNTMNLWRSKGLGPTYYNVGGSIRYRVSDLNEYLAKREIHDRRYADAS